MVTWPSLRRNTCLSSALLDALADPFGQHVEADALVADLHEAIAAEGRRHGDVDRIAAAAASPARGAAAAGSRSALLHHRRRHHEDDQQHRASRRRAGRR
jgi:hypothetical protein